mmetsp:Transcript_6270/g.8157  ORF Transcript_6270/g.8157 Transcript_6270/m.8157 type:complete len:391 (-) Transcript_6270:190-1362(-)
MLCSRSKLLSLIGFSAAILSSLTISRAAAFKVTSTSSSIHRHLAQMALSSSSSDQDVAWEAREAGLFRRTPLIYSPTLSEQCQHDVYLKLDCLQASGSFKDRGMGHLCMELKKQGSNKLISSSGGNAGLAVASTGKQLGMIVQVIVPETTKSMVVAKLKSLGAEVTVFGENWNAADQLARQKVDQDATASYISPYDNPLLWTGHSTLIDEIVQDLKEQQQASFKGIGTLLVSVGGGGLLCGVLEGLERQAFKTKVLAAETVGASSFGQALEKGELVRLDSIDSIATSLGALEVTAATLERIQSSKQSTTLSAICTDAQAVYACLSLAQDHRLLVEPACGAALAVAYSEELRTKYLTNDGGHSDGPIVIQVCGGSGVNVDLLAQWKQEFGL